MKRLAWATDIHLNFLGADAVERFCDTIVAAAPDALLVGGDVGEAESVERFLCRLEERLSRPVYFVLGNHDFYGGSISEGRARAAWLSERSRHLRWLPVAGVVRLGAATALLGHDGWADGRAGDYPRSRVMLNDYVHIRELVTPDRWVRAIASAVSQDWPGSS